MLELDGLKAPWCLLDVCCGVGTIGICYALHERMSACPSDPPSRSVRQSHGSNAVDITPLVVGMDICQAAVDNARINSSHNGLSLVSERPVERNTASDSTHSPHYTRIAAASYVCARAEIALDYLLGRCPPEETEFNRLSKLLPNRRLVAVVDPPREVRRRSFCMSVLSKSLREWQGLHVDCARAIRNCTSIERLVYISCNPLKSFLRDAVMLCGPKSKRLTGAAFRPMSACPVDLYPMTPNCDLIVHFERCRDDVCI